MQCSDARMAVISRGAADISRVGSGNKKINSDYVRVGRGWIR